MKYFVVLRRSDTKENMSVHEFPTFNKAKRFKEKHIKSGHKGEAPIGTAHSKDEFLRTFTEYRPKGPGSRGGTVIGFYPDGSPKYFKKSFSLVIKKDQQSYSPRENQTLKKSILSVKDKIDLIKGILNERKGLH
jgi:hypothetical protein